jgi:hypothetical protein
MNSLGYVELYSAVKYKVMTYTWEVLNEIARRIRILLKSKKAVQFRQGSHLALL